VLLGDRARIPGLIGSCARRAILLVEVDPHYIGSVRLLILVQASAQPYMAMKRLAQLEWPEGPVWVSYGQQVGGDDDNHDGQV